MKIFILFERGGYDGYYYCHTFTSMELAEKVRYRYQRDNPTDDFFIRVDYLVGDEHDVQDL